MIWRLYVPSEDSCGFPLSELVFYNTEKKILQLRCQIWGKPDPVPDDMTLVVYIDGACRDNGRPTARASYGVYFGPDSPYNKHGLLDRSLPQTSTRAEIEAFKQAIAIVQKMTDADFKLCNIKIATDSSFIVHAMSQWVERWIENNGLSSRGKKVAHFQTLKQLHELLDYMEYSDQGGRYVKFWHVTREMNREADALANKALDEA